MLLAIFKFTLFACVIFTGHFCYILGAIISPVLLSSMNNYVTSIYETSVLDFQNNTISDSFDNNTTIIPNELNSRQNVTFDSNIPVIPSVSILSSFPSEVFSTTSETNSNSISHSNFQSYIHNEVHSKLESFISTINTHYKNLTRSVDSSEDENATDSKFEVRSVSESLIYKHFHTPLMSLLVASSSIPFPQQEATQSHFLPHTSLSPHHVTAYYNESSNSDTSAENDHKKLLMLVLRAEDCSRLSKLDFEKMLGKLMTKFGFGDAVPEVSNAKCFSHLHINLTVGGKTPTLRFLPNIDDKHNVTVDVLNRTFRVVKLEKVDLKFEKSKSSNASSTIIASVAEHESIAYISVGVTFGLVLVLCLLMCCIKCCCIKKSEKRFGTMVKSAHVRLRPEDYTLTPIPRPTSLYVDYYRSSVTADIYSTTSAGSIVSTTPTVDQGIIQPFDTSIVPLEDSSAIQADSSRDPSVESVPAQSDLKTFNIHGLAGKGLRNTSTDSQEQLNPKRDSRKPGSKTSGVANPTFQRY